MKLNDFLRNIIFLFLIFFVVNNKSISQTYFIRNYSVENGLPTSFISDVTQDLKGRMWFANPSGISVYDGFRWENYSSKNGLPNTPFKRILTDEKGIVWCLPSYMCESIVFFSNDSIKTIALPEIRNVNNNLNTTSFVIFYENDNPVICIGTYSGIYLFKNNKWEKFTKNDGLLDDFVFSVKEYKNKLFIVTKGGLSVFDGNKFDNSLNNLLSPKYSNILTVAFDKEGENFPKKLWLLGKEWIGYIENNQLKIISDKFLLPSGIEFEHPSLVIGKNNLLFFGNFYYTLCVNKITGELFPLTNRQGFKSDGSTSIFIDKEENIWKTGTRGIDKLNNLYLVNYDATNGLQEDEVTAIFEYQPGKFALGHNDGLTLLYDNKTTKIIFPSKKSGYPGDNRVMDICKGKDGNIWLACASAGLGKLDKNGNIKWLKLAENNYVSSVILNKKGTVCVTTNDGIFQVKNDKLVESSDYNVKKQFYRRMFLFDNDEAYFASSNGLTYIKDDKTKYISSNNDEKANNTFAVIKDKNGNVLIGTKGGLYTLINDSIKKFNLKGFEINNSVYAILQDNKGNYWFGTENGVIKWDGNGKQRFFTKGNGLSGTEINRAALINDSYGNVWIGTESGMTCYRPEFDNNTIPVPEVIFLNSEDPEGNKFSLSQDISLKSNIKSLFFNFRGISFYNENYLQYKIKLVGFDADWYEVNQNNIDKIRYTNLIHGDYKFQVRAKNISGEWSDVFSSSVITIEVPYYQKWWFILVSVFVMAGLFYMFYKLYLNRIYYLKMEEKVQLRTKELRETEMELRNTQILLEDKVKERTAKLGTANEQLKETNATKDKFFSIIAHDLKSPFVGLLGYSELLKNEIDSLPKEKITEYSENLNKNIKNTYNLLENLLNWALFQTGKMSFNPESVDLFLEIKSILELFDANAGSKNITIVNNVKINTYIEADKNMIRTVLYNLISNAIKFTNQKGQVSVKSEKIDDHIEISVSDNGVGIPRENLEKLFKLDSNITTKGTSNEKGTGLGLLLCKEMIEKHNGSISVESEEGKGTTFRVIFPSNYS